MNTKFTNDLHYNIRLWLA